MLHVRKRKIHLHRNLLHKTSDIPAAFRNIPRRDRCDQDRASARGKVRVIMAVTPTLLDKWNILQAIVADTLPASAKVIAARLLEHRNGHSGRCFPSIPTLAAGVDMSDDTARRAVRALKRRGWISISRRAGQSHLFEFDWSRLDPSRTCEATPHESARGTPPESATRIPLRESLKKNPRKKRESESSLPAHRRGSCFRERGASGGRKQEAEETQEDPSPLAARNRLDLRRREDRPGNADRPLPPRQQKSWWLARRGCRHRRVDAPRQGRTRLADAAQGHRDHVVQTPGRGRRQ